MAAAMAQASRLLAAGVLLAALAAGLVASPRGGEGGIAVDAAAPEFENLKNSVLRFTVYRRKFYWSKPYVDHDVSGSLGSGFLVKDDPPVICTCAHVVSGADKVYVQVTRFGKTKFPARVATISNDADVALVVLEDPAAFKKRLAGANLTAFALPFAAKTPPVGHPALAPGFPLGQRTMTLSTGVISGVDHVTFHHRNLAIQSTAIISQGNSGSPLLDGVTREVIGMNYAKNTGEAQINYVVPLWRLRQVIQKYEEGQRPGFAGSWPQHFRLLDHGLVITPGSEALYMLSSANQSCGSGPLVSALHPASPFNDASPRVVADSFLVSMDGVKLDRYGQGSKDAYVQELVDFEDLMWMRNGTGEQDVEFVTCAAATGELQTHRMSLAWREDRQGRGVRYVYEPRFENVSWEIFGDLIFMDLTVNHIQLLGGGSVELARFLSPAERQTPRLAVLLRREGGEAEEALGLRVGGNVAVVDSVNGHPVSDLEDLRKRFVPAGFDGHAAAAAGSMAAKAKPGGGLRGWGRGADDGSIGAGAGRETVWSLRTSEGREFAALFRQTLLAQASEAATEQAPHLLSPASEAAMKLIHEAPSVSPAVGRRAASLFAAAAGGLAQESPPDVSLLPAGPLEVAAEAGRLAASLANAASPMAA